MYAWEPSFYPLASGSEPEQLIELALEMHTRGHGQKCSGHSLYEGFAMIPWVDIDISMATLAVWIPPEGTGLKCQRA